MSLLTVYNTLTTVLNGVAVVPAAQEGIPDAPLSANRNALYFEYGDLEYSYDAALRKVHATGTRLEGIVVLVWHKDAADAALGVYKDMLVQVDAIVAAIEAAETAGTFKNDGGDGFACSIKQVRPHFRPDDPTAGCLITLGIEAYRK